MGRRDEKRTLRAQLIAERREIPTGTRQRYDAEILEHLTEYMREITPCKRLAAYEPFGTEPGRTLDPPLPERLGEFGTVLVPLTLEDRDLDWTAYDESRTPLGPDAIAAVDLVVVPALAVGRSGIRLGRGGGSYDRALARVLEGTPVVALLYDHELLDEVPGEEHDRPVTHLIAPGGARAVGA
ncbi:5-formyltetrahydrofolate cyclo-ligase [Salininema proteolyticum]|uniref:5-formyltetrahydrofolate cyclo-ligase n=1 Tax=Salininema proteolyticum TaxID=1607685 RepID=A0ABV8TWK9_9ACTN